MKKRLIACASIALIPLISQATVDVVVDDSVIAQQRATLAENTKGKGFGPQAPRDIDNLTGMNHRAFGRAPDANEMNLCNIHFHKNAEHKGGEFSRYAGNGDGKGYNTGYVYTGKLSDAELKPFATAVGKNAHGQLLSGDTIEVHYVYSTAQVKPGPTLGACLSESINNPQLRVETQVYVLVNDRNASDFVKLTEYGQKNGVYQALNIPDNTGKPIQYPGSTTGPGYNETASPLQVSWSVRPKVAKVDIATVAKWLKKNDFKENHAHGVRNLVTNPDLLAAVQ
ncbi:delta-class carbonic anhydrase [Vibrio ostreicida]|uniref:Delta-class carbonic anhydrase n=1 Tax=Vibrio ostreicida TaxID=526588 RepID=A0ABT8BSX0_9VIBR|nr:delta-class carbonic anhydrase [Vibrio ostreicida]MDN3609544.1 delta-class carbonic anhydrase [Vibrio ostreicida]NPD08420.1 hypothetical protein [Vibrio ostreicida]